MSIFFNNFRALTLSFTLLVAGGCSVTNPYIDFKSYDRRTMPKNAQVSLHEGVSYAIETKNAYRAALGDRTEFRNLLGLGLIPLAATTLALGIDGKSEDTILVLGAIGASALGIGTWFDSKPTERAYIAGYNAINCATDAIEPLRIVQTEYSPEGPAEAEGSTSAPDSEYILFIAAIADIDEKIAAVETQIGTVQLSISRLSTSQADLIARANSDVATARIVVENAVTARRNGTALRREINLAGSRLVAAVDRITGEVDMAVHKNQPDFQALTAIIGGLGKIYSQFTAVPDALKPSGDAKGTDDNKEAETGLEQSKNIRTELAIYVELRSLYAKTAELAVSARQIADFVNAVAAQKPTTALKQCGIDVEEFAGDIAVNPQGPIALSSGDPSSVGRTITGGRAPYRASLVGAVMGITVVQPDLFGPAFVVQTDGTAKKGTYSLLIADGAGSRQTLSVVVDGAAKVTANPPNPKTPNKSQPPVRLTKEEIIKIQKATCNPKKIDGDWGPDTQKYFDFYKQGAGGKKTDEEYIGDLLKMSEADIADRCKTAPVATTKPLEDFADALLGINIDIGKPESPISFSVDRQPAPTISEDGKRVQISLTHRSGEPPSTTISIDAVKQALRNAVDDLGQKIVNDDIEIINEVEIKPHLTKAGE